MNDVVAVICFTIIVMSYMASCVILCVKRPSSWGWVVLAFTVLVFGIKIKTGG